MNSSPDHKSEPFPRFFTGYSLGTDAAKNGLENHIFVWGPYLAPGGFEGDSPVNPKSVYRLSTLTLI